MLETFIQQWLIMSDYDYTVDDRFVQKARAYGVDFSEQYVAIVVEGNRNHLPNQRLAFDLDHLRRVYIFPLTGVHEFLATLPEHALAGVSRPHFDLTKSIKEAVFALALTSPVIEEMKSVFYEDVVDLAQVVEAGVAYPQVEQFLKDRVDEEVQVTLWLYGTLGHSMSELSDTLHVHRRTVQYRLDKIAQLTDLNPRVPAEILPLLVSYMRLKTAVIVPALTAQLQRLTTDLQARDVATS